MSRMGSHFGTSASCFFSLVSRQRRSQSKTTVEHAALRGLAPTCLASGGCLPHARVEPTWRSHTAAAGATPPGRRLFRSTLGTWQAGASSPSLTVARYMILKLFISMCYRWYPMYLGCLFCLFVYVEFFRICLQLNRLYLFPCTIN